MPCHVYTNEGTLARKIKNIRPEAIDLARQVKQKGVPGSGFDILTILAQGIDFGRLTDP